MNNNFIILLLIILFFLFFTYKEQFESIKDVINTKVCKSCKVWNHLDAKTKCNSTCKKNFPDKNISFTGKWSRDGENVSCECSFPGKYKKEYIGCPVGTTIEQDESCFIWNDNDANKTCQKMCDRFLPNSKPKWTGLWRNTSADSSACECEYYD
jgi:hypothetical protein